MTEAYKIGITIAMTNLAGRELSKLGAALYATELRANGLKATLLTIGTISATILGGSVVVAIAAGVQEARKFQLEAAKFSALGFGDQVNTQAKNFAKGMNTIGTSATENMALVGDAMAVFKDMHHAQTAAPLMAEMSYANRAIYGAGGGDHDRKFMDMLKVIEFRNGLNSDAEFKSQADMVQKVIDGSRNRVDASQMLMALKTGGVALSQRTNEAFYLGSEPLIQEFGGSRFGTANMSAYQNLVMMRTTQQALTEMMRLDLLDPSKVEMNKFTGKVARAQPGAFKGQKIFEQEDNLSFLEKVLLPAFAAKGITKDADIITEIGRIFTNRTASALFSRVYQQRGILHTQIDANNKAMDIGQLKDAANKTFDGNLLQLTKEWKNLTLELGEHALPVVINALKVLINIIKSLENSWVSKFVSGAIDVLGKPFDDAATQQSLKNVRADSSAFDRWALWWSSNAKFGTLAGVANAATKGAFKDNMGSFGGVNPVPPAMTPIPSRQSGDVYLDGRKVGQFFANGMAQQMSRMPNSGSSFDGRMTPIPVQ